MKKGFAREPEQKYIEFLLELKTRMSDDSELLLGTAKLRVPEIKNRSYEQAIAISAATEFLLKKAPPGTNQIFIEFNAKTPRF